MSLEKNKQNEYIEWVGELKHRIQHSQLKTALTVNNELLQLYWDLVKINK